MVAGVIGLLLLSLLLAIAAPALPAPSDQVRSSNLPFTASALAGRDVYAAQACGSCHTQMIRNVVSDVGLGPVTLADTNQVPGYRRYGPDLAAVGGRVTDAATLAAIVGGAGGHPIAAGLSDQEINDLVAYLLESR
jgi:cbb3-type cytochrome oxidase cytochrome c subunit